MISQPKASSLTKRTASNVTLSGKIHHAQLGQYAANLWKEKVMTDVLIVVQNQEFKAHKAVLACYSPYFSNVFVKPGFSDVHYLQLPTVTAKAFGILVEYMYTGELKVTCQDLSDVYRSARKLGMKGAMNECIELLHVTTEDFQNTVYLYVTARQLKQWECTNRAFKLLVMSFEKLVTTKQFLDLDVEQILELFSSNELGARSEVIVFLAALKWINYKYLEREEYINSVFAKIRFPLMSKEEILACYHPPILPGIVKMPDVKRTLLNATCYVLAKSLGQENIFSDLAAEPRIFLFETEPMVLWDLYMYEPEKFEQNRCNQAATKIQAAVKGYITRKHLRKNRYVAHCSAVSIQSAFRGYMVRKKLKKRNKKSKERNESPLTSSEIRRENKSSNKVSFSTSVFQNQGKSTLTPSLYIMGGFNTDMKGKGQNVIYKYDMKSKKWEFVTTTPLPRQDARILATHEALYILGGCNPLDCTPLPLKECFKFVFQEKVWMTLPPMIHARSLHASVIFNNTLLVVGGKDDENRILSSIETYDALKDTWEEFKPLPQPRMAMGAVICEDALWVAGGLTCVGENISLVDSVYCFETNRENWFASIKLLKPLAFPTLLCDEGQLFCIGGAFCVRKGELESSEDTFRLDYKKEMKWKNHYPMPFKCHNVIASISDGNIYIFGGFSTDKMGPILDAVCYDKNKQKWSAITKKDTGFLVAVCKQI